MSTVHYTDAATALQPVQSGQRVFIHGSAATPVHLLEALQARHAALKGVELVSITSLGEVNFDRPELRSAFYFNSLFVSAATRSVVNSEAGDYVPIFLSEIPQLFYRNILPLDVALIQVSPPDAHGYVSLGTSVDIARAAVETARYIVAQVNPGCHAPMETGSFTSAGYTHWYGMKPPYPLLIIHPAHHPPWKRSAGMWLRWWKTGPPCNWASAPSRTRYCATSRGTKILVCIRKC
ncbi:hypothetical protein [Chitinophaga barathri]|uniref:hypothetical protein n=1 Tax=Chitinophaga barathri TaxID=1647451 RepID=UPI001F4DED71|nr:hypothetical protein [Chitinophaga barathri]